MNEREKNKRLKVVRTEAAAVRTKIQRDTFSEVERLLTVANERARLTLASAPTDWERYHLPKLQQSIRQTLDELALQAGRAVNSAAGRAWEAGVDLIERPLEAGGVRISAMLPQLDTQQLLAMRSFMTDKMRDISMTVANRINTQLGLVAIGAQSPGDAIGRIAELFDGGRGRAITVVRTELGRAFSTAAYERQQQAAELLPGLQKQWRRSGKVHSRFHHDAADGQIQAVDQPFILHSKTGIVHLRFPRDPQAPPGETVNCGCESLPHMAHWDMTHPKKKPFTAEEVARSRTKREIDQAATSRRIG